MVDPPDSARLVAAQQQHTAEGVSRRSSAGQIQSRLTIRWSRPGQLRRNGLVMRSKSLPGGS
jgi:hypothetical protein